jgi:hypothetical protein
MPRDQSLRALGKDIRKKKRVTANQPYIWNAAFRQKSADG